MIRANFSAEFIIHPVSPLLQGSALKRDGAARLHRLYHGVGEHRRLDPSSPPGCGSVLWVSARTKWSSSRRHAAERQGPRQAGRGHQPLVGVRDRIGLLAHRALLPLMEIIEQHEATPLPERVAGSRLGLDVLGSRFRRVCGDRGRTGSHHPTTSQRNIRPCGGRPSRTWPTVSKWIGRPWPCWVPAWMSRSLRSNGFSLKTAVEPAAP